VYDVHSSSGLRIDIDDLLRARKRACVEISRYDCGLSYLPADATVLEVQRICRAYFERLESKAFRAGNTHALLCFRLHHLRTALRVHNLYGDSQGYARDLERKLQDEIERGGDIGAPPKIASEADLRDRTKAILDKLWEGREYWHLEGRHGGKPKWTKIVGEIDDEASKLVRGPGDSEPISGERAKQIIEGQESVSLDRIRQNLGVPEPS